MRSLFWLLVSLPIAAPAAAQTAPPARVELHYELTRNGSTVAEVVERLERATEPTSSPRRGRAGESSGSSATPRE